MAYQKVKKVLRYVHLFRHNTGIGRTDRQTDSQKCHNNIALCMHCVLTRDITTNSSKSSSNISSSCVSLNYPTRYK